ncbi:MAG: hypothetical protein V3U02_10745 [Calditrichia bacterium]
MNIWKNMVKVIKITTEKTETTFKGNVIKDRTHTKEENTVVQVPEGMKADLEDLFKEYLGRAVNTTVEEVDLDDSD